MVWICLQFIRSARRSERGRKTEKEMGRQHQGMGRPGVHKIPEGSGEQRKMEETNCEVICGSLSIRG